MPTPPKVGDAIGLVGRVEIQRQADAKQAGYTQRHVRVAREIKIQLKRIGEGTDPSGGHADRASHAHRPEGLIRPRSDCICNEDLFSQAHRE